MKRPCLNYSFLESYKPSKYNIVVCKGSDSSIIYNSLTGTRIHFASDFVSNDCLSSLHFSEKWPKGLKNINAGTLNKLIKHHFLIPVDFDEWGYLLALRAETAGNPQIRRICIILTRSCNLNCAYCYQDKELNDAKGPISKILSFVKNQAVPGGLLQITWFGGEPTLRLKLLLELSNKIIRYCDQIGAHYDATISTNGVLLNKNIIRQLLDHRINKYQISLDGPDEVQEMRRASKNKKPTYDAILSNISQLVNSGADVVIKIIVDTSNWERVPELFDDLANMGILRSVRIAIQETESKFAANEYGARFDSLATFSATKVHLLSKLYEAGYHLPEPTIKPEFCSATSLFTSIIDLAGNQYRCATEPDNKVGEIMDNGDTVLTQPVYEKMFSDFKAGTISDCNSCKVYPICGGGCVLAANNLANRQICSFFREAIRDYLLLLDRQDNKAISL